MDHEKQALAPSAPAFQPQTDPDPDTFYPPLENPPPYSYPDPAKFAPLPVNPVPQSAYAPIVQQPPPPTVIQIMNAPLPQFGTHSVPINCPFCHAGIRTKTKRRYTAATHATACVLCCLFCCCFAWIPYFCDSLCDIEHECPNCDKYLGTGQRRYYRR